MILEFGELARHRRVAPSQLLDCHVLRLVVGEAKIVLRAEEAVC